jgi:hypothetical protein
MKEPSPADFMGIVVRALKRLLVKDKTVWSVWHKVLLFDLVYFVG